MEIQFEQRLCLPRWRQGRHLNISMFDDHGLVANWADMILINDIVVMRVSFLPNMSTCGTVPVVDLRLDCMTLGGSSHCGVTVRYKNSSFSHVVDPEHPSYIIREFYKARPHTEPNQFIFGSANFVSENRKRVIVEMKKLESGGIELKGIDYETHRELVKEKVSILWPFGDENTVRLNSYIFPNATWSGKNGETTLELDLAWFETCHPNIKGLLEGIEHKPKDEFFDIVDVLYFVYHECYSGFLPKPETSDMRIECLAIALGFDLKDRVVNPFLHKAILRNKVEETPASAALIDEDFTLTLENRKVSSCQKTIRWVSFLNGELALFLFVNKLFGTEYVGFQVAFSSNGAPPPMQVSVHLTSNNLEYKAERHFNEAQTTLGAPTLLKCSQIDDGPIEVKVHIQIDTTQHQEPEVKDILEMPGIRDITLKFGEKRLVMNRDLLLEYVDFFKGLLLNEHSDQFGKKEVDMKAFSFEGILHLVEILYHTSKDLSVSSFRLCAETADALLCDKVLNACNRALANCRIPNIANILKY